MPPPAAVGSRHRRAAHPSLRAVQLRAHVSSSSPRQGMGPGGQVRRPGKGSFGPACGWSGYASIAYRPRVRRRAHDEPVPIAAGCACMGGGPHEDSRTQARGAGTGRISGHGNRGGLGRQQDGSLDRHVVGTGAVRLRGRLCRDRGGRLCRHAEPQQASRNPYLAIMEVVVLVMAPVLVLLAVVIHACAPEGTTTYSMTAPGWMLLVAGFTMTVHLVQLTVVRRIDPSAIQGFQYLFNWHWPSVLYASPHGPSSSAWLCCSPLRCSTRRGFFRRRSRPITSDLLIRTGAARGRSPR